MKTGVITPVTSRGFCDPREFVPVARQNTELSQIEFDRGPTSIESAFDEMLPLPRRSPTRSTSGAQLSTRSSSPAWAIRGLMRRVRRWRSH